MMLCEYPLLYYLPESYLSLILLFLGVPELKIAPFDPFFAKEVVQRRGGLAVNYRLVLRNVEERGWTQSEVTNFR